MGRYIKPVRRKWDGESRTTRWQAFVKVGTHPVRRGYLDGKPVVGRVLELWTDDDSPYQQAPRVIIDRILLDESCVFCSYS